MTMAKIPDKSGPAARIACVVCHREIEPAPRYFTAQNEPRHMLCETRSDERNQVPDKARSCK
jgi:hypothetical protein